MKKGDYRVFVDIMNSSALAEVCRWPLVFTLYLAAFYVLNLSYPKHSRHTLTFLQKYVLRLTDE